MITGILISFENFPLALKVWLTGAKGLAFGLSWLLTCLPTLDLSQKAEKRLIFIFK